jgi:hypothetical protein
MAAVSSFSKTVKIWKLQKFNFTATTAERLAKEFKSIEQRDFYHVMIEYGFYSVTSFFKAILSDIAYVREDMKKEVVVVQSVSETPLWPFIFKN